jgi:predicted amidophosphoribosyltransferase
LANVNQQNKLFCDKDFKKISFITKPVCNICHSPLNLSDSDNIYKKIICGKCAQKKPKYDQAISVLAYNQASKALISGFKYFKFLATVGINFLVLAW